MVRRSADPPPLPAAQSLKLLSLGFRVEGWGAGWLGPYVIGFMAFA